MTSLFNTILKVLAPVTVSHQPYIISNVSLKKKNRKILTDTPPADLWHGVRVCVCMKDLEWKNDYSVWKNDYIANRIGAPKAVHEDVRATGKEASRISITSG
jgi:hypothetical protein